MIQPNRDFEEKRNFIRMKIDAPVRLTCKPSGRVVEAVCRNLSGTGLLAEAAESIALQTEVEAYISSQTSRQTHYRAEGVVTRCEPTATEGHFLVGVQIERILE